MRWQNNFVNNICDNELDCGGANVGNITNIRRAENRWFEALPTLPPPQTARSLEATILSVRQPAIFYTSGSNTIHFISHPRSWISLIRYQFIEPWQWYTLPTSAYISYHISSIGYMSESDARYDRQRSTWTARNWYCPIWGHGKKRNTKFGQCDVAQIPSLLSNETITGLQSLFVFSFLIEGAGRDENKSGQRLWQRST